MAAASAKDFVRQAWAACEGGQWWRPLARAGGIVFAAGQYYFGMSITHLGLVVLLLFAIWGALVHRRCLAPAAKGGAAQTPLLSPASSGDIFYGDGEDNEDNEESCSERSTTEQTCGEAGSSDSDSGSSCAEMAAYASIDEVTKYYLRIIYRNKSKRAEEAGELFKPPPGTRVQALYNAAHEGPLVEAFQPSTPFVTQAALVSNAPAIKRRRRRMRARSYPFSTNPALSHLHNNLMRNTGNRNNLAGTAAATAAVASSVAIDKASVIERRRKLSQARDLLASDLVAANLLPRAASVTSQDDINLRESDANGSPQADSSAHTLPDGGDGDHYYVVLGWKLPREALVRTVAALVLVTALALAQPSLLTHHRRWVAEFACSRFGVCHSHPL